MNYRLAITLILCAAAFGCGKAEQNFIISQSDKNQRADTVVTGTNGHSDSPKLPMDTFLKLAAQLERLTIEHGAQGENIHTIVDEWGFVMLKGDTIPAARRLEIANRIHTTFEGARRVDVSTPAPIIEQARNAMSEVASQTRDRGGDDFRAAYVRLNPDQVRQAQHEGALILDLRSREEFEREHIKDAINVPLGDVAMRLNELPERELTILYFSGDAGRELNPLVKRIVFERKAVYALLDGDLNEWGLRDYPTEGSEAGKRAMEKFKRLVDENQKAWDGFLKARDITDAKGQIRK